MSDIKRVFVVSKIVCLCVLFLFQLKKRREFFFFFGKIVLQTHNIVFKPTETLAKNTKKIQKNVPARARYIIRILSAPRNNVVTIQRVSCHPGTPRMLEY